MKKTVKVTQEACDLAKTLTDANIPRGAVAKALKVSTTTVWDIRKAGYDLESYRNSKNKAKKQEPEVPDSEKSDILVEIRNILVELRNILAEIRNILRQIEQNTKKRPFL